MDLLELKCINCGAPILGADVNLDRGLARCSHCGAMFAIDDDDTDAPPAPAPAAVAPAVQRLPLDLPMPKNFHIENYSGRLVIRRRWWHPMFLFLIVFAVFWNGFMIFWHTMALASGAWFMSCFGLIHTAVGVGLIYFILCGFLNSTIITADYGTLSVRHGPLPWIGNKTLDPRNIRQLYCRQKIRRSNNGGSSTWNAPRNLIQVL
ncbi:MAG: hypothetical protein ACLFVU_13905 [Phycisphaerae bacterium]